MQEFPTRSSHVARAADARDVIQYRIVASAGIAGNRDVTCAAIPWNAGSKISASRESCVKLGAVSEQPRPLRLAEAAAVLSLATDLSMGQPLEHGLRTALGAVRAAQAMGLPEDEQVTVFYTGVLHFAGCTAESEIDARFFGDELVARPQMATVQFGSRPELMAMAARTAHRGSPPFTRAAMMAKSAFGGLAEFRKWAASHCDVARILGARMGLSEPIQECLRHLYERWDGKGQPGELRGEQVPLPVRLMQVAQDADMAYQRGGAELARRVVTDHAGAGLDPQAVAAFLAAGDDVFKNFDAPSIWDEAMAAEPGPQPVITEERLDECLSAVADFADLKSMWTVGHSRGVAELAEEAAVVVGLDAADILLLRRAALVHDIGRVAVPVSVWAKPGALTRDEREQVRLHAYHSERVLDVAPGLRQLARLAGSHGERCDGSRLPPRLPVRRPGGGRLAAGRRRLLPGHARAAALPGGAVRRGGRAGAERRRRGGQAVGGGGQRGAGRRGPAGQAGAPAGRAVRARVPGARPGGPRPGHQAGRPQAGHLPEDLRPPHPAGVRQGRRVHQSGRDAVRAGKRPG